MTVLELMIVVAITAIMLALAMPSTLSSLKGYRLHSDASAFAGYLNLVRMRAASQYAPYRLDLDPTAKTYIIEKLSPVLRNSLRCRITRWAPRLPHHTAR